MATDDRIAALEAELALSRRLLADAQQLARVGSWEWDIATGVVTWSDELYRIYGLDPQSIEVSYEEFLGRVHPDDRASVDERNRRCFADHRPFEDVKRIVRPDGSEFLMRTRGEMVLAPDGGPVRMIGVCEDVSAEVRAREASDRLVSLVENSHDAIFTCTLEGVITSWNPAAEQLYGHGASVAMGARVDILLDPDGRTDWLAAIARLAEHGESLHEDTQRRAADGSPVEVSAALSPLRDHTGAIVGVADSARDLGDRRKAEVSEARRRRAMDLNDTVIQSLVLARYRLATEPDDARRSLGLAIRQCQRIVDELLGAPDAVIEPGSLRREAAPGLG
jgi:PAS domain S-box-containing protein